MKPRSLRPGAPVVTPDGHGVVCDEGSEEIPRPARVDWITPRGVIQDPPKVIPGWLVLLDRDADMPDRKCRFYRAELLRKLTAGVG